jgi:hypothetical protein
VFVRCDLAHDVDSGFDSAIDDDTAGGRQVALLGAATYLVGTICDFVRAPLDASAYNANLSTITVTPVIQRVSNGFGLGMSVRF